MTLKFKIKKPLKRVILLFKPLISFQFVLFKKDDSRYESEWTAAGRLVPQRRLDSCSPQPHPINTVYQQDVHLLLPGGPAGPEIRTTIMQIGSWDKINEIIFLSINLHKSWFFCSKTWFSESHPDRTQRAGSSRCRFCSHLQTDASLIPRLFLVFVLSSEKQNHLTSTVPKRWNVPAAKDVHLCLCAVGKYWKSCRNEAVFSAVPWSSCRVYLEEKSS